MVAILTHVGVRFNDVSTRFSPNEPQIRIFPLIHSFLTHETPLMVATKL